MEHGSSYYLAFFKNVPSSPVQHSINASNCRLWTLQKDMKVNINSPHQALLILICRRSFALINLQKVKWYNQNRSFTSNILGHKKNQFQRKITKINTIYPTILEKCTQSFLKELNIFVQKLVGQHQCYAVKPVLNGHPGTQRIINDVMMFEDDSLVLHCASLLCIIVVTCSVHM